jgi:glycosyltransferase involved in cell wall biosynthesis
MSHGTPVVVRNRGPLPELVARGGGIVFETAADLDAALRRLLGDAALRTRLSGEASRTFETQWTEEAVVGRFVELVERARQRRARCHVVARSARARA